MKPIYQDFKMYYNVVKKFPKNINQKPEFIGEAFISGSLKVDPKGHDLGPFAKYAIEIDFIHYSDAGVRGNVRDLIQAFCPELYHEIRVAFLKYCVSKYESQTKTAA